MSFVYGTVLVVTAIFLLGLARFAVTRHEDSSWVRRFAATETMALVITTVTAFGIAFLCAGLATGESGPGMTELGASIGVIALAIVGTVRIFRISGRRPTPAVSAPNPGARATI